MPKRLGEKTIFKSRLFTIKDVDLQFGEKQVSYEVLEKSDSCAVIPVTEDNKLIMIKEYAVGHDLYMYDFPGGRMEKSIDEAEVANKELQEEVGYKAKRLNKLGTLFISPGYLTQKSHIFLGRDLVKSELIGDEIEIPELFTFSFQEVEAMIYDQTICEARTIAGFFLAKRFLSKESAM